MGLMPFLNQCKFWFTFMVAGRTRSRTYFQDVANWGTVWQVNKGVIALE